MYTRTTRGHGAGASAAVGYLLAAAVFGAVAVAVFAYDTRLALARRRRYPWDSY